LLLLEHPPVVTLGRGASEENLLAPPDELRARGIEVHRVGRGGDVTYHGPGQLVGYPIIDLDARAARDVHAFLRLLEGSLIEVLAELGLAAKQITGMTGVYVDLERSPRPSPGGSVPGGKRERKIASIGIGLRRWVTFHGFALNLTLDLADFETIVPCGLGDVEMTSLARELPGEGSVEAPDLEARARAAVGDAFRRRFA
jgi:lipoate-protein ligase B